MKLIQITFFVIASASLTAGDVISGSDALTSTTCGGVLDGLAGAINYKVGQPYNHTYPGESCIWTIRTELKETIQLELIEDGFAYTWYPIIQVTELSPRTRFQPNLTLTLTKGDRKVYNVRGPLIYVHFATRRDTSYPGTGFSLLFRGTGNNIRGPYANTNDTYNFRIEHDDKPQGIMRYPDNNPGSFLPTHQIYSITFQPEKLKHIALTTLAPISMGFNSNQVGYSFGCGYLGPLLVIHEQAYWGGPSVLQKTCRTEKIFNSTVVSPSPIVMTFYTYSNYRTPGFEFQWENIVR